ncbi:hypothetical protein JXO52_00955 [bacterium]|nr:hypothetical protein [bacterium]
MRIARRLPLLLMLLLFSCRGDKALNSSDEDRFRGGLVHAEIIADYSPDSITALALAAGFTDLPALNDSVRVVRIHYYTEDGDGTLTPASGALMLPLSSGPHPLLSLHHGTEILRTRAASIHPFTTTEGFLAVVTGALGFITCVPDYLGFGVSECMHPYHHALLSAVTCIDFLRAARTWCEENDVAMSSQLFLGGYSEGGYVTMAVHREMEAHYSDEFTVTASAPMAGAYDMLTTARLLFAENEYGSPAYLAFIITAYNHIYGWDRLTDIFREPYAGEMEDLFDGTHSYTEIQDFLPSRLDSLFTVSFLDLVQDSSDSYIRRALEENTLIYWSPAAPIRLYHGMADATVPYENSLEAYRELSTRSSSGVDLISFPGLDHGDAALPAITMAFAWFQSFLPPPPAGFRLSLRR